MASVVTDITGLTPSIAAMDPNRIAELERQRRQDITRAWGYYDGDMPEQLKVRPGDFNDNVRLGYAKLIINASVSSLFGADLSFQTDNDTVQELVDFAWGTDEQKMVTLARLGVNGGVAGHAFVRLQRFEDGTCRVVVLDPSNVDVDWAPDDFSEVHAYNIEWSGWDEDIEKMVYFRQRVQLLDYDATGPWSITDYRSVGGSSWTQTGEAMWDFPFAPIVDCQNLPTANEFYGAPDLDNSKLDLIDRINGAASNIQKILRYHAHPKVFIYGYSGKDIDLSADVAVNFPSTDTKVDILGMPTDLASAFAMMNRLTDELFRLTATPKAALGDTEAAAMAASGLALKLGFNPMVEKTNLKRKTYGYMLNEINQRIQVIAGNAEPAEVELNWPPITPDDPMGDAQTAVLKQQLGVSKRTLLEEMGYDPEIELDQSAEEADTAMQQSLPNNLRGPVNEDARAAQQQPAQMQRRSQDLTEGG